MVMFISVNLKKKKILYLFFFCFNPPSMPLEEGCRTFKDAVMNHFQCFCHLILCNIHPDGSQKLNVRLSPRPHARFPALPTCNQCCADICCPHKCVCVFYRGSPAVSPPKHKEADSVWCVTPALRDAAAVRAFVQSVSFITHKNQMNV